VPDTRTIWMRRVVLMAVVGLLVAIPVTLIVRGGDHDSDGGGSSAVTAAEVPEVGETRVDRKLGVALRLPEGWKRSMEKGAVSFRSGDGSALIAISAPGPEEDAKAIHSAAVGAIDRKYRAVEVMSRDDQAKLGQRPAELTAISARQPKDRAPLRILVATARGKKRAYLVEVFAAGKDPSAALVEAQVLINNLRIKG
jgi:hypothetical protein